MVVTGATGSSSGRPKRDSKLSVDVTGTVSNVDDDGYIGSLPNTPTSSVNACRLAPVPQPDTSSGAPSRLTSTSDDMGVFTSSEEVLTAVPAATTVGSHLAIGC